MDNKKGRTDKRHSPTQDTPNHTDPLIGWHSLGKASRQTRQAKRGWKRRSLGMVRGDLLALLLVMLVALFMLAGVVQ